MAESAPGFYLTLPSNASMTVHPNNKPQSYTVELSQPINLEGSWEVALMELQYPTNWHNLTESTKWEILLTYWEGEADLKETRFIFDFPPGSYSSLEHLCTAVSNQLNAQYMQKCEIAEANEAPFNLMYNDATKKVVTKCSLRFVATTIRLLGDQLLQMLGFFNKKTGYERLVFGDISMYDPSVVANSATLFVYSDIVEHQFVGDTKAPLLRTSPLCDKSRDVKALTFQRPFYLTVKKNYINSIRIELRNDAGELVHFQTGKSILVLHFRKRHG